MIPSTRTLLNPLFAALSIGRLPFIRYPQGMMPPKLAREELEGYEVCTYYAMLIQCKKLDNTNYNEQDLRPILAHHLGLD